MRKILSAIVLLCAVVLFTQCGFDKSRFENVSVEATFGLPLGSLTISDSLLFALSGDISNDMEVSDNGLLKLNMIDTLDLINSTTFSTLFDFSPASQEMQIEIDNSFLSSIPGGTADGTLIELVSPITIDAGLDMGTGVVIDKVVLAYSSVYLQVASGYDLSELSIEIPSYINQSTSEPLVVSLNSYKQLTENYELTLAQTPNANNLQLVLSGKVPYGLIKSGVLDIKLTFNFNNMVSATGYFGHTEVTNTPLVTYDVNDEFKEFSSMVEYIYFRDPQVKMKIFNEFDTPVAVDIATLNISGEDIVFKDGYDRFFVAAEDSTVFSLTNESTVSGVQFSNLINTEFEELKLQPHAILNPTIDDINQIAEENRPANYVQSTSNSVYSDKTIRLEYTIVLPFDIVMINARFSESVKLDLSDLFVDSDKPIKELAFGFTGTNSLPLEFSLNAYLDKECTKSIFNTDVFVPASVSTNVLPAVVGEIKPEEMLIVEVPMDVLDAVMESTQIYFEFRTTTKGADKNNPRETAVQVLSPTLLDLNVVLGTSLEFQTDIL